MIRLSSLAFVMKKLQVPESSRGSSTKNGHWTEGLLQSMQNTKFKIFEDNKVVVIKDKYPKAKYHYLILPKENIPSITHVTKENTDLLEHMERVGQNISKNHKDREFIIGYHAIPSMQRLHLHVISTDFNSIYLKTKYHWNSFTTPFFLSSRKIRIHLQENGQIKMDSAKNKSYLNTNLKCHKCCKSVKTMPELKKHLLEHISD